MFLKIQEEYKEDKMLSVEAIGKNIEQAIENALFELKAIREDVDINILDEGGFFRKAKVLVTISDDAKEKYEKRELFTNKCLTFALKCDKMKAVRYGTRGKER